MIKSVVVAGDVAVDWIGWEDKPEFKTDDHKPVPNWMLYSGLRMVARPGGAALTGILVDKACKENNLSVNIEKYHIDDIESIPPEKVIHSNTLMKGFPMKGDGDSGPKVFRVSQFYGYTGPEKEIQSVSKFKLQNAEADMVILDDAGNGFRDRENDWPDAVKVSVSRPAIILKMSQPLGEGKHLIERHVFTIERTCIRRGRGQIGIFFFFHHSKRSHFEHLC